MTPTLSVEAIQLRLIWLVLMGVATRFDGTDGGCVSGTEVAAEMMKKSCGIVGSMGMLSVNWPLAANTLVEIMLHEASGGTPRFVDPIK